MNKNKLQLKKIFLNVCMALVLVFIFYSVARADSLPKIVTKRAAGPWNLILSFVNYAVIVALIVISFSGAYLSIFDHSMFVKFSRASSVLNSWRCSHVNSCMESLIQCIAWSVIVLVLKVTELGLVSPLSTWAFALFNLRE